MCLPITVMVNVHEEDFYPVNIETVSHIKWYLPMPKFQNLNENGTAVLRFYDGTYYCVNRWYFYTPDQIDGLIRLHTDMRERGELTWDKDSFSFVKQSTSPQPLEC